MSKGLSISSVKVSENESTNSMKTTKQTRDKSDFFIQIFTGEKRHVPAASVACLPLGPIFPQECFLNILQWAWNGISSCITLAKSVNQYNQSNIHQFIIFSMDKPTVD